MRWREATIGIFLPKLAGVLAKPAHRAQVLALHRDRIAGLEHVDDLLEGDVEVGLAGTHHSHVGLARHEEPLRGLRRPIEDLAHHAERTVARFCGVANPDDPLDYGHGETPTVMEPRVL